MPTTNSSDTTTKKSSFTAKLVCGAIAGVIGTSIIFPLDIIKTRLQNQKGLGPKKELAYNGMVDCARLMMKNEGILGFYRGLAPNLVGIIPEKAIKLAVNDYARERWAVHLKVSNPDNIPSNPDNIPLVYGMVSGATAGFCQVVATNPMEIVKIQLQLQGSRAGAAANISAVDVVKKLGLKGLYKGTSATLARDVPFSLIFFSLVSVLKNAGTKPGQSTPLPVVFGSGILSGALAAAVVTPMDVIKTRLQVIATPGDPVYNGQLDCYRYRFISILSLI